MEHNSPVNGKTERPYKGKSLKTLVLAMEEGGYIDPRFVTFSQAKEMGRMVRKGQKAAARLSSFHNPGSTYPVFNIEQTVKPGERVAPKPEPVEDFCPEAAYAQAEVEVPVVNTEAASEEPDYAAF